MLLKTFGSEWSLNCGVARLALSDQLHLTSPR